MRPPTARGPGVLAVVGVLLAAAVVGTALYVARDDAPAAGVTITWGGREGHPPCVYDADAGTVRATLNLTGEADDAGEMTVTVTAYADENTSRPVGAGSRSTPVDGAVDLNLVIGFPVRRAPHVDEDGVAACTFTVA